MRQFQLLLCGICAGISYYLSFAPNTLFFVAPLLFFFMLLGVRLSKNWKEAFFVGWTSGLVTCLMGYPWITYVAKEFGNLPSPFPTLIYLGYSAFGEIHFAVFTGLLFWILQKSPLSSSLQKALLPAALCALIELISPRIFPDHIGHVFYETPLFNQVSDLFGVHGLTFLVVWTGASLFCVFSDLKLKRNFSKNVLLTPNTFLLILSLIALTAYSQWRLSAIQTIQKNAKRTLSVALIQANIGNVDKLSAENGLRSAIHKTISTYKDLSVEAAQKIQGLELIVWPETAYPDTLSTPLKKRPMEAIAKEIGIPFIIGSYDTDYLPGNRERDYNAIFYIDENGTFQHTYRKVLLLAFGEYFPFSDWFPELKDLVPEVSDFGRGEGPGVIDFKGLKISPLICYEAIFSTFVKDAMKLQPDLFLNATNDSWFGPLMEPDQHLALAKFRSIEYRRPLIRSTNTGITTLIDATGKQIATGKRNSPDIISGVLPIPEGIITLYAIWGDLPLLLISLFFSLFPLLSRLPKL